MKYAYFNYDTVEKIVPRNCEMYWDGWTLNFWTKDRNAYTDPRGVYRNNSWGHNYRVEPNEDGLWKVPGRYVQRF